MRVIAGTYRSRILKSLKGHALRPTSDRLRETLFNILAPGVAGSHFIDVFAGTGAVGIEALSRGAVEAVFIENHAPAAALIRRNLQSLDALASAKILPLDAIRGLEKLSASRGVPALYDFVFLDPPYAAEQDYSRVLQFLSTAPFLAPSATIIAEHYKTFSLPEQIGRLSRTRVLVQGDAALSFFCNL
jgi:16S rRNA (guanine966-N2)-methyltransferase